MNRKQRRAASKTASPRAGAGDPVAELFAQARDNEQQGKHAEATRLYKRVLLLKPDHAEACNNLGVVLLAQGKRAEASDYFARALTLMPQLLEQFAAINATLATLLPEYGRALRIAMEAWPRRPNLQALFGARGLAAIADNPLLARLLQALPVRDIALERLLTAVRVELLHVAARGDAVSERNLAFCCTIAKQCFINEYVFATTPEEDAEIERLAAGNPSMPFTLAAIAMYRPLHSLPDAEALLTKSWPAAVDELVTQQLREPQQEQALRADIPQLTSIDDAVSQQVRRQYEENPYPRWVDVAGQVMPVALEAALRDSFPSTTFAPLPDRGTLDVLVAGCGTGYHAIAAAQKYRGAQVLALDLSLTSLAYAKRKTPLALAPRIAYAQADILKLGGLGKSFDMIDASGVLHHLADPLAGWRILLDLLRPGGVMHLGFYSESGRRDVVAARAFIAERGYSPDVADIRRCRQDILATPLRSVARFNDFFSASDCRDLLFHVQESRLTIPKIKEFIAANGLHFLGFEFGTPALAHYHTLFAHNGWSPTDLDRWHAIEHEVPDTFSGMYNFWVQKP